MPSSFCTREPHSFTPRTVTFRLSRGTMVQCEAPRIVIPDTSTFVPWMEITCGVGPLSQGQSEPSRMRDPGRDSLSGFHGR